MTGVIFVGTYGRVNIFWWFLRKNIGGIILRARKKIRTGVTKNPIRPYIRRGLYKNNSQKFRFTPDICNSLQPNFAFLHIFSKTRSFFGHFLANEEKRSKFTKMGTWSYPNAAYLNGIFVKWIRQSDPEGSVMLIS